MNKEEFKADLIDRLNTIFNAYRRRIDAVPLLEIKAKVNQAVKAAFEEECSPGTELEDVLGGFDGVLDELRSVANDMKKISSGYGELVKHKSLRKRVKVGSQNRVVLRALPVGSYLYVKYLASKNDPGLIMGAVREVE